MYISGFQTFKLKIFNFFSTLKFKLVAILLSMSLTYFVFTNYNYQPPYNFL